MNADDALDPRAQRAHDDTRLMQQERPHSERGAVSSHRVANVLTVAVCLWALFETPWEMSPADDGMQTLALLAAKLLLVCTALCAVQGSHLARLAFAFLCGSSLIAVGSTLPFECIASTRLFGLSFVECVLKALLLLSLVISRLRQPS